MLERPGWRPTCGAAPELTESDTFRERFIRESRLAASPDHANISRSTRPTRWAAFIAMRYVQGHDLRAILGEEEHLSPYQAIAQIGTQVARALDAAHFRGLVHRDVKPGNVLVTSGEGSEEQGQCYFVSRVAPAAASPSASSSATAAPTS